MPIATWTRPTTQATRIATQRHAGLVLPRPTILSVTPWWSMMANLRSHPPQHVCIVLFVNSAARSKRHPRECQQRLSRTFVTCARTDRGSSFNVHVNENEARL